MRKSLALDGGLDGGKLIADRGGPSSISHTVTRRHTYDDARDTVPLLLLALRKGAFGCICALKNYAGATQKTRPDAKE